MSAKEKSRYPRVIEGKEKTHEILPPHGVVSTSGVPERMMAIKVSQKEEISGGKDRMRKGVDSAIGQSKKNRGA